MKLNHINLIVLNIAAATNFFITYFDFRCEAIKGDNVVAVLKGSDGFTLVLMKNNEANPVYPDAFHIGFILGSLEDVNEKYQKLVIAGFAEGEKPKKIRDSFGFYFKFENLMIEVGCYLNK